MVQHVAALVIIIEEVAELFQLDINYKPGKTQPIIVLRGPGSLQARKALND